MLGTNKESHGANAKPIVKTYPIWERHVWNRTIFERISVFFYIKRWLMTHASICIHCHLRGLLSPALYCSALSIQKPHSLFAIFSFRDWNKKQLLFSYFIAYSFFLRTLFLSPLLLCLFHSFQAQQQWHPEEDPERFDFYTLFSFIVVRSILFLAFSPFYCCFFTIIFWGFYLAEIKQNGRSSWCYDTFRLWWIARSENSE